MPRDRSTATATRTQDLRPAPMFPSNALVASAVAYKGGKMPRVYRKTEQWQREAYRHYAICGEARYAARFFGHAMSRGILRIGKDTEAGRETITAGPAVDWMDQLFAGKDGQEQMLEAFGVHLTIAGECYLVGRTTDMDPDDPDNPLDGGEQEIWEVVSVIEMRVTGQQWSIVHEGYMPIVLEDTDTVIRVWIPDPAERTKADSPFRSLLPILTEIEYLTLHIFTQTSSRLAGAGLMFVSQDIDFPVPIGADGKPIVTQNQAHGLMLMIANSMEESFKDPGSASARVPIIVSVPGELLKGGKVAELVQFWSTLDDKARDMRNDSIRRFALGLEMPPEQLLGMGSNPGSGGGSSTGVSHWGAWQIEEQTIKMFIEPMFTLVVNTLTVGYLRPLMGDALNGEKIFADTTALRLRPDRSVESLELNARGLLKDEVTVTENGFSKKDMMTTEEQKIWLLRKMASGSATPEQVAFAVGALFPGVDVPTSEGQQPRETRPEPTLDEHPVRPRTPQAASVLPVLDGLVYRTLERCGAKIRRQHGNPTIDGLQPWAIHTKFAANGSSERMLDGAWTFAPQVLEGTGLEVEPTVQRLNAYCLSVLTTQQPHTRERLAKFMELT